MEILRLMAVGKCTCCKNAAATAATVCLYMLCLTFMNLPFVVEGICYSDNALRSDDKTSMVDVVVKARIQGRTENGDLLARVTKTLKGDPTILDKQDITVTGLEAEGPFRLGSTEPAPVTECMQNAITKQKYILFLLETEEANVYSLQFEGVLNSKEELRVLRKVIETEDDSSYNTSSTPSNEDNTTTGMEPVPSSSSTTSHYVGCPKSGYCLNGGQCAMLIKLKKYFCFCNKPWIGPRCQLHDPYLSVDNSDSNNVLFGDHMQTTLITLGIIFGALLLLAIICAVAYVRYKSSYYQDRRRQLEEALQEFRNAGDITNEQLEPLNRHHQNNNSVNQRYNLVETENIHFPTEDTPPSNGSSRSETRHYSLQPSVTPVQTSNSTQHIPRTMSDTTFNLTRTSEV